MVQAVYRVDLHVGHAVGVHSVSETHSWSPVHVPTNTVLMEAVYVHALCVCTCVCVCVCAVCVCVCVCVCVRVCVHVDYHNFSVSNYSNHVTEPSLRAIW